MTPRKNTAVAEAPVSAVDDIEIIWEEPTPRGRPSKMVDWEPILAPLVDHPKRWAVVRTLPTVAQASSAAVTLRKKHESFEFAARSTADDESAKGRLFARFVGEPSN